jgi:hypothetical protein
MRRRSSSGALIYRVLVFLTLITLSSYSLAQNQIIKKSSAGICHPPESSYYERTRNFRSFQTLRACIDSGGRFVANLSSAANPGDANVRKNRSTKRSKSTNGYDCSQFGAGWADTDGDCQNSRSEALIATSSTQVRFADDQRCRVTVGSWISAFSGKVIQNSSEIDIDHVVPLRWAWDRGAAQWSRSRRVDFANDPVNLLPVEAGLNRSKGARGPDEWLPPSGKCGYIARFVRIVRIYGLTMSANEERSIMTQLARC